MVYDPQSSTSALNARGYADTPEGRAQAMAGVPPSGNGVANSGQINNAEGRLLPNTTNTTPLAGGALDDLATALRSGDMAKVQEAIREFNLNYANSVAQLYGQNFGPGNPAPIGAATLASGQATGAVGYIPGFSGGNYGQTSSELATQAGTAQSAAGLTGWYAAPSQSQYTPGTFVHLDPNTYDTQTYGPVQLSYVLPSGQLQRVNIPQAKAMGWDGDLSKIPTLAAQTAMALEQAPPSNLPQQTIQGLTSYSNLNTAAQNNALAEAGVTGYYDRPAAGLRARHGRWRRQVPGPDTGNAARLFRARTAAIGTRRWPSGWPTRMRRFRHARPEHGPLPNQPGRAPADHGARAADVRAADGHHRPGGQPAG